MMVKQVRPPFPKKNLVSECTRGDPERMPTLDRHQRRCRRHRARVPGGPWSAPLLLRLPTAPDGAPRARLRRVVHPHIRRRPQAERRARGVDRVLHLHRLLDALRVQVCAAQGSRSAHRYQEMRQRRTLNTCIFFLYEVL